MRQKPHILRGEHKLHSGIVLVAVAALFLIVTAINIRCVNIPIFASEALDTVKWKPAMSLCPAGNTILVPERLLYPADAQQVMCTWRNLGNEPITYGEPFTLHKKVNGQWLVAQRSDGIVLRFNLPAYILEPQESRIYKYNVAAMLDRLTPGEYRIAAEYFVELSQRQNIPWQSRKRQAYAYFIVE